MITTAKQLSVLLSFGRRIEKLTLSLEGDVDILEHLHCVWAAALLLGIKEYVALLGDLAVDHIEENGAKGLLHIRADPDQEPVFELHRSGAHGTDTRTSADNDAAAVEMAEVG